MDRRHFFQSMAAAATTGIGKSAAERVNIAIIGLHSRGRALAGVFARIPDANIQYLVDVDERAVGPVLEDLQKANAAKPKVVSDMRRVFDDKSIDAVAIATPDHWHAPAAIMACDAGKDVYVEKPCSHNIREGRLLVEAARRNKRIVQHGTQARSRQAAIEAMDFIHSGKIGTVHMAKAWDVQKRQDIGHKADSPVPAGVDFDTWIGPAVFMPFNENRYHYTWHWNWNFGTGDMGNDGAHQIDMARWALGVDYPTEIAGMARKLYFQDDQQTPDSMNITFDYGDKALIWEMRIWNPYGMDEMENGVAVYGTEGMVHIGRYNRKWGFKVFDKAGKLVQHDDTTDPELHQKNFIESVRSRKLPNADIGIGHLTAVHCHLANIVSRTGRNLRFDPGTETVIDDPEANLYVKRTYRTHWGTPKML